MKVPDSRVPEKTGSPKPRSPRSSRTKPKSVHKVTNLTESEETHDTGVFTTSYHKVRWHLPNLRFPCPLVGHNHEISSCEEFFSFNPMERWNKMDKGKLCYTCLSPKDVCVSRRCEFAEKFPETLKCEGCAPWAHSKNVAPFSILFCRIKAHSKMRASYEERPGEVYRDPRHCCRRLVY